MLPLYDSEGEDIFRYGYTIMLDFLHRVMILLMRDWKMEMFLFIAMRAFLDLQLF